MRPAFTRVSPEGRRRWLARPDRRAAALALVLLIHMLLITGLILLARARPQLLEVKPSSMTVTLLPSLEARRSPTPAPAPARRASKAAASRSTVRAPKPIVAMPKSALPPNPLGLIPGAETFDLAKVPVEAKEQSADADTTGAPGAATGPAYGPVMGGPTGPHGEPLYPAEWVTEPTHAELAYYLPRSGAPQDSWGEIACKTVPGFRVEDCIELADSPPGSGLARGLRQAAWQFHVRPPRIGGKLEVGAWVRIRIDFTESGK